MSSLSKSEMNTITKIFSKADVEDFDAIAKLFNSIRDQQSRKAALNFKNGDKVAWTGKKGSMTGTIDKVMAKNAVVKTDMGNWKVSVSMLRKV